MMQSLGGVCVCVCEKEREVNLTEMKERRVKGLQDKGISEREVRREAEIAFTTSLVCAAPN